jgi:hypothetical protein
MFKYEIDVQDDRCMILGLKPGLGLDLIADGLGLPLPSRQEEIANVPRVEV